MGRRRHGRLGGGALERARTDDRSGALSTWRSRYHKEGVDTQHMVTREFLVGQWVALVVLRFEVW